MSDVTLPKSNTTAATQTMNRKVYTVGGTVQAGGGLYIERRVDAELTNLCRAGEFAYILTTRQVGKSSLMVATARKLKDEGILPVLVDLTRFGAEVNSEQWYLGLLSRVVTSLLPGFDLMDWWESHTQFGHADLMIRFFQEVLLTQVSQRVVVFIDEVDTTLSLPFADDFFAAIRAMYNYRVLGPEFGRLSFVLIGVANPNDLISDAKRTPFNIGQRIDLTDFTFEEALPLARFLGLPDKESEQVLRQVLKWTGGHPFLTQRLCREIAEQMREKWRKKDINALVDHTFLGPNARNDSNLNAVRKLLIERVPAEYKDEILRTYLKVRRGQLVPDEEQSMIRSHLRLTGIVVRDKRGRLRVRNRIYGSVFDGAWVREHLPVNWSRRLVYAAVVIVATLLVINVPVSVYAWNKKTAAEAALVRVREAKEDADKQRQIAVENARESSDQKQLAIVRLRETTKQRQIAIRNAQESAKQRLFALHNAEVSAKMAEELKISNAYAKSAADNAVEQAKKAGQEAERNEHLLYDSQISLAYQAYKSNDLLQAENILVGVKSLLGRLSGFEYYYVSTLIKERLTAFGSDMGHINNLTISPDGRTIAVDSFRGFRLWDITSGREITTFSGKLNYASSVAFSPDGKMFAAGNFDSIKLWEFASGREFATLKGNSRKVAFSPDGKMLASAAGKDGIRLWDIASGREITTFSGKLNYASSVAFSPDGKMLASISNDTTIKLWDLASGRERAILDEGHMASVMSVAVSPDSTMLVSTNTMGISLLWDIASGKATELKSLSEKITSAAFSPDGKTLAFGSDDGIIIISDLASGKELVTLKGQDEIINSLVFSPDGRMLLSAGVDCIRLWILASGRESVTLNGHEDYVKSVAISPDGRTLASASDDKTIRLWDLASGKERAMLKGHLGHVGSVAISPDGRTLASASDDSTIRLWDLASGRERAILDEGPLSPVNSVAISPDGRTLATGGEGGIVKLWDLASYEMRILEPYTDGINSLAFSPDGKTLASGSSEGTIELWDLTSGMLRKKLKGHGLEVYSVAISPDGKTLASGSGDKTIKLWDLASGREIVTLNGHLYPIYSVAISPDSKTLASASSDKTIKLWDLASGREIVTLPGHSDYVKSVVFSPDGRMLVSASKDKTIKLWRAQESAKSVSTNK